MVGGLSVNDITILLFAIAFALLVAVLALKNEIQTPRNEVRRYERNIKSKIPEEYKTIFEISERVFSSKLDESQYDILYGFLGTVLQVEAREGLEILRALEESKRRIRDLDKCYDRKYVLIFWLTVVSYVSGFVSLALDFLVKLRQDLPC